MGTVPSLLTGFTLVLAACALATRHDAALRISLAAVAAGPNAHQAHRQSDRFLSRLGRTRAARLLGRMDELRDRWELAGRRGRFDAVLGVRLMLGSLGLLVGLAASLRVATAILLAPILTLAGLRLPEIALAQLAKRRKHTITAHVPDLVELLVSTTDAGLNPLIAFQRAAEVLRGPLGEELRITARQIELGLPWKAALEQLAARTQVPSLRRLVVALARSSRLGAAIGSTLRSVAMDLRGERRARAEELARRAPIKMLFPLVFLILPAFLLLTVGPVVLATLRSLH
jgi:tight adherence protein C